jgi:hypothetical protein
MLKENELIGGRYLPSGSPSLHREADRPINNFARQAVIAIGDRWLLNELANPCSRPPPPRAWSPPLVLNLQIM